MKPIDQRKLTVRNRLFLSIPIIEGIFVLIWIFWRPSSTSDLILGYSTARLLVGAAALGLLICWVAIFWKSIIDPQWYRKLYSRIEPWFLKEETMIWICVGLLLLVLGGVGMFVIRVSPLIHRFGIYGSAINRLLPLFAWSTLLAIQVLLGIFERYRTQFFTIRRKILNRFVAIIFLSTALLIHIFVIRSVIIDTPPVIWGLHNDTIHRFGRGADFYALYHASSNLSEHISPYRNNLDGVTPYFYPFRYLPIVAQAGQVFLRFSPENAYRLWVIVLESLLVLFLVVLWGRYRNRYLGVFATCILLISSPNFLELYLGQFTFAATVLALLGSILPAGYLYFSFAVWLKLFPLAIAPVFVRHRHFWKHLGLAIVGLVVFSLPYFLKHPGDWERFTDANLSPAGGMHTGNFGLVYLFNLIAQDINSQIILDNWSQLISVFRWCILGLTALVVFFNRTDTQRMHLGVSALLLAHFVSYANVWEHHMSGVIVIGVFLLTINPQRKSFTGIVVFSLLLLAAPTSFGLFDVVKDAAIYDPAADWAWYAPYLILIQKALPTVLLYCACMLALIKTSGGIQLDLKILRTLKQFL